MLYLASHFFIVCFLFAYIPEKPLHGLSLIFGKVHFLRTNHVTLIHIPHLHFYIFFKHVRDVSEGVASINYV